MYLEIAMGGKFSTKLETSFPISLNYVLAYLHMTYSMRLDFFFDY